MKTSIVILFIISLTGCSKDFEVVNTHGTKLVNIAYFENDVSYNEHYSYDTDGALEIVEKLYSLGTRYEISYADGLLKEYKAYRIEEDKLIFRDSILYNTNGTIQAIYKFSINAGENLPLSWIYEFEYDAENKLHKKSTYFKDIEEYHSIEKYYWENNDIIRVEEYNGEEELYYEFFYTYDDKSNYKKDIPMHLSNPIHWSENNIVEMNWNDYHGNLDIVCRPCVTDYQYNLDGYPVHINYNWGRVLVLEYE